jgi:hypothetical protein
MQIAIQNQDNVLQLFDTISLHLFAKKLTGLIDIQALWYIHFNKAKLLFKLNITY